MISNLDEDPLPTWYSCIVMKHILCRFKKSFIFISPAEQNQSQLLEKAVFLPIKFNITK